MLNDGWQSAMTYHSACVQAFEHKSWSVQGGTYGGSVLGAAAACATLDVIKEEGLLENANERGAQLVKVRSGPWYERDFQLPQPSIRTPLNFCLCAAQHLIQLRRND